MATNFAVDPAIFDKYVVLPEKIRTEIVKWFRNSNKVSILLTGKGGAGKSTLVNSLIGNKVAKEGETLKPETTEVTGHKQQIRDVEVTVWDSPGLQDGSTKGDQYLAEIKRKCKGVDLCVYCISLKQTRFTEGCDDIIAMKKLTRVLGKRLWEHAIFVLTFANVVEHTDTEILRAEDAEKPQLFEAKMELWKNNLTKALVKDIGLDKAVASRINVVPAGYTTKPALLDRDHWLSPVWFAALYAMNPEAQPAMMKINLHRIVESPEEIREEDKAKFIKEQPLIFSKRGTEIGKKFGEGKVGTAVGHHMGEMASQDIVKAITVTELSKQIESFFLAMIALLQGACDD